MWGSGASVVEIVRVGWREKQKPAKPDGSSPSLSTLQVPQGLTRLETGSTRFSLPFCPDITHGPRQSRPYHTCVMSKPNWRSRAKHFCSGGWPRGSSRCSNPRGDQEEAKSRPRRNRRGTLDLTRTSLGSRYLRLSLGIWHGFMCPSPWGRSPDRWISLSERGTATPSNHQLLFGEGEGGGASGRAVRARESRPVSSPVTLERCGHILWPCRTETSQDTRARLPCRRLSVVAPGCQSGLLRPLFLPSQTLSINNPNQPGEDVINLIIFIIS